MNYGQKNCKWHDAWNANRFTKDSYFEQSGTGSVGGYYATRAQRVDLLGYVREACTDKEDPYREGALKAYEWNAPTLLLGRLPSSLKYIVKGT